MWSGAATAIPDLWALCNGSNGTPNLQDRFIVGAGSTYSPGNTGGSAAVSLTTAQLPSHSHSISLSGLTASSAGAHTHAMASVGSTSNPTSGIYTRTDASFSIPTYTNSAGAHTHSITGSATIDSVGSGSTHENRPPYYALCFIMKIG